MIPKPRRINSNTYELVGGQVLTNVHPSIRCAGKNCCIHEPSDHHMNRWPQNFREDRGMIERICEHSVGHPDPDDPTTDRSHGCDSCCHETVIEESDIDIKEAIEETKKWVAE